MEKRLEMHRIIVVNEVSQVGQARREVQDLAKQMDLSEEVAGRAALVVTELSTNLLKHSFGGGEILYRGLPSDSGEAAGLEVLALDKGRGIPSISRAFQDGFSTAGSPGTGLGAIQRMSDSLEIFSAHGHGTVINARICPRSGSRRVPASTERSICAPLRGFEISGDYCASMRRGANAYFLVSDGLGHGEEAALASHRASDIFLKQFALPLPDLMMRIHEALRGTRGAAVALASFHAEPRILKYVAVGNIETRICSQEATRGCATLNGTAGARLPKVAQFEYEVPPGAVVVMHSDGLSARWNLNAYPGLTLQSPGAIAGVLYRDFARPRDDATVLVFST